MSFEVDGCICTH